MVFMLSDNSHCAKLIKFRENPLNLWERNLSPQIDTDGYGLFVRERARNLR